MKIYHTETQADYDALMVELENDGVTWRSGVLPTKENNWKMRPKNMCVAVSHQVAEYGSIDTYLKIYPDVPITKYKAKADEKMKFTKENAEKVIDEYFWQADLEPCGDLIAEIHNLDDTPEKVVVPKCFDDYYKGFTEKWEEGETAMRNAVQKVSQYGFGYPLENQHDERLDNDTDLSSWVLENKLVAINAILNGYTIERERFYCIPLPHLETAGGTKQYLTKSGAGNYFALSPCIGQKQRYTKEELEQVPEIYKPFAVLLEVLNDL